MIENEKKSDGEGWVCFSSAIETHDEILKNHEQRLKEVEKFRAETRFKLENIERSIDNFERMFLEQSKGTQEQLSKFTEVMLEVFVIKNKHANEIECVEQKGNLDRGMITIEKKWALIILIATIVGNVILPRIFELFQ